MNTFPPSSQLIFLALRRRCTHFHLLHNLFSWHAGGATHISNRLTNYFLGTPEALHTFPPSSELISLARQRRCTHYHQAQNLFYWHARGAAHISTWFRVYFLGTTEALHIFPSGSKLIFFARRRRCTHFHLAHNLFSWHAGGAAHFSTRLRFFFGTPEALHTFPPGTELIFLPRRRHCKH